MLAVPVTFSPSSAKDSGILWHLEAKPVNIKKKQREYITFLFGHALSVSYTSVNYLHASKCFRYCLKCLDKMRRVAENLFQ